MPASRRDPSRFGPTGHAVGTARSAESVKICLLILLPASIDPALRCWELFCWEGQVPSFMAEKRYSEQRWQTGGPPMPTSPARPLKSPGREWQDDRLK